MPGKDSMKERAGSRHRRLYLVRHGESEWNLERRIQGNSASNALSETGKKQAALLGAEFERLEFASVYCSDVERAVETARIALGEDRKIEFLKGLREISFGSWEGKLIEEVKEESPGMIEEWFDSPSSVSIDDGENLSSFRERIVQTFDRIISESGEGNILAICHGGVICSYLTYVLGMDLDGIWSFSLPNASITTLVLEFRPRLRLFGGTSHFTKEAAGFDGMPSVYDI